MWSIKVLFLLGFELFLVSCTPSFFSQEGYGSCMEKSDWQRRERQPFPPTSTTLLTDYPNRSCQTTNLIQLEHNAEKGAPRELGHGRESIVYSGTVDLGGWYSDDEQVAVKSVILGATLAGASDSDTVLRFKRTICLLKNIAHPAAPTFKCAYSRRASWCFGQDIALHLVMSRIPGKSVEHLLQTKELDKETCLQIIRAIKEFIEFLHANNLSYQGKFFVKDVICPPPQMDARVMFTGWGRISPTLSNDSDGAFEGDKRAASEIASAFVRDDYISCQDKREELSGWGEISCST